MQLSVCIVVNTPSSMGNWGKIVECESRQTTLLFTTLVLVKLWRITTMWINHNTYILMFSFRVGYENISWCYELCCAVKTFPCVDAILYFKFIDVTICCTKIRFYAGLSPHFYYVNSISVISYASNSCQKIE